MSRVFSLFVISSSNRVNAGLPNIVSCLGRVLGPAITEGVFYNSGSNRAVNGGSGASCSGATYMDLSLDSSHIYGHSNTVTPESQKTNFLIKY